MSYCPKCGAKTTEEMSFCQKCGAALKVEQTVTGTRAAVRRRDEKGEKREKEEKGEKTEKREKHEYGFLGPLIGGLVLIFLGLAFYLQIVNPEARTFVWPLFFVLIGIIIIIAAVYGTLMAGKRHPKT